jgi:hypothetical protein
MHPYFNNVLFTCPPKQEKQIDSTSLYPQEKLAEDLRSEDRYNTK